MAKGEALRKAQPFNDLSGLTGPNPDIDRKRLFQGLSNHKRPSDPRIKTAAPAGPRSGGEILGEVSGFKNGRYDEGTYHTTETYLDARVHNYKSIKPARW